MSIIIYRLNNTAGSPISPVTFYTIVSPQKTKLFFFYTVFPDSYFSKRNSYLRLHKYQNNVLRKSIFEIIELVFIKHYSSTRFIRIIIQID